VVDLLARNWPEANIVVWTRYPDLFSPPSPLVTIERFGQESEERVARYALWGSQVTFVPYYHFGSQKLWRRVLSLRAVTFTHDVGFAKTSDYFFAPRLVPKRFDQHEIINLLDLISLWPLARSLQPPGLDPQDEEFARLSERYPVLNERPYVTIHIDSSLEMKRWPEDRWEFVARRLAEETGALCCFIGAPATHDKAQVLCERLAPHATLNMCKLDLPELIALIAHARLAVGTCSGPKHLAYALRTPTFTLYGPESEHRWGAWFDRPLHGYMSSPVEYLSPREHAGLPPNHLMRLIPAEAAAEAIVAHYRRIDRAH
jgi:ADP-heptose:LPS heptosyltransferase